MTSHPGRADHDRQADATPRRPADDSNTSDDAPSRDPEDASLQDWIEADKSRPTLPGETPDGLDDTDEEVRHQAEDRPLEDMGDLDDD